MVNQQIYEKHTNLPNTIDTIIKFIYSLKILYTKEMAKLISTNQLIERISSTSRSFSPRLINWVEPIDVSGFLKTGLYTEVNSNLSVGDRVFITNGNYDSDLLITSNKYKRGTDGYKVISVDNCKLVLDIDYTGKLPWNDDSIDSFIRVYPVRDNTEFRYVNRMITTEFQPLATPQYGGSLDSRFNQYQDNVVYSDNDYSGFSGFGQNAGLSGSPGFFLKGVTSSWTNITSDFTSNFSSFLGTYSSTTSNNRIKIMNATFTYNGMEFKEGFVYKFENGSWIVDVTYFRPIISKGNFRDGIFKGTWNSGLFGRQDKKVTWNGISSTWNTGTILNSIWATGSMNSIFTSNTSYFADIDVFGLPYQKSNTSNNRGFGYNYILDSEINRTSISNGNFYGSLIGTQSATFSMVETYIRSLTQSSNIKILGGEFNACSFESAEVRSSEIKNSRLNNTRIIKSKSTNSHYTESLFYGSKFNSDSIIKILAFDEWVVNLDQSNPSNQSTYYKFYISEDNYNRLKHKDQFYINGILVGNGDLLNFFDRKFILNDYTYHDDMVSIGPGAIKVGFQYTVILSTTLENEYVISGTTSTTLNTNILPSIDVIVNTYPVFPAVGMLPGKIDITSAYIIDSDFRSGLFETSDWNSGNSISNNYDGVLPVSGSTNFTSPSVGGYAILPDMFITSIGDDKITIQMPTAAIDDNLIKVGSIVYLNSVDQIDVLSNITTIPDTYKVVNITLPKTLDLEEIYSTSSVISGLTNSTEFTTTLNGSSMNNRYNYLHSVKINNSNVKSGIFRRSYLKNSLVYNSSYNNKDIEFSNIPSIKSLVLGEMILKNTGNNINSGTFIHSFITPGNDMWNDGIFYNSSWLGQTFSNGVFRESRWENGTFINGLFYKSNSGGGIDISSPTYKYEKYQSFWRTGILTNTSIRNDRYSWINGSFINGEFYKSGWEDGTFQNGKFYLSDFFGGTFSNGTLGDIKLSSTDTNFYNGLFDNGTVENASVYATNTDFVSSPGGTTSPTSIIWNNGIFKSGLFGSTVYNRSAILYGYPTIKYDEFSTAIWNGGYFNGGSFESGARWKNGTFNGGNFTSDYGWTMSTSTYSTDYSWENGVFNGGEFGVGSAYLDNDKNFYDNGNSTWFTGEFNGGKFKGRVWNNGVLTSGDFEGSGTYSVISPNGTTCSNPNNFVDSFRTSGTFPQYYESDGIHPTLFNLGDRTWWQGNLYECATSSVVTSTPTIGSFIYATMSSFLSKSYGLWRNGTVTDVKDKFIKDKKIFTEIQRKFTEKKIIKSVNLTNVLWNTGTFSHPSGTILNSVWLDGRFETGKFKGSSFNPYVKRDGSTQSTFNFDDNTCYWQNGILDSSDFYISKWNDGKFLLGTGIGMIWQNGVANYMNAFNIFWENGTWRNGNWYGSSFTLSDGGLITDDYTRQIIFRGMSWSGTSSLHVWDIFTQDSTDSPIIINATASIPPWVSPIIN